MKERREGLSFHASMHARNRDRDKDKEDGERKKIHTNERRAAVHVGNSSQI